MHSFSHYTKGRAHVLSAIINWRTHEHEYKSANILENAGAVLENKEGAGRGGAGRRMSSFFPFLSCISSFHFFCGVTLRATKEKTGQKHRLRTVVFTMQEAFTSVTWRHQIQTKKLLILLSFYFHEVLQHLKTFIFTNFRFQRFLRSR